MRPRLRNEQTEKSRDVAQWLSAFPTHGDVLGSSPSFQTGREEEKEGGRPHTTVYSAGGQPMEMEADPALAL